MRLQHGCIDAAISDLASLELSMILIS